MNNARFTSRCLFRIHPFTPRAACDAHSRVVSSRAHVSTAKIFRRSRACSRPCEATLLFNPYTAVWVSTGFTLSPRRLRTPPIELAGHNAPEPAGRRKCLLVICSRRRSLVPPLLVLFSGKERQHTQFSLPLCLISAEERGPAVVRQVGSKPKQPRSRRRGGPSIEHVVSCGARGRARGTRSGYARARRGVARKARACQSSTNR